MRFRGGTIEIGSGLVLRSKPSSIVQWFQSGEFGNGVSCNHQSSDCLQVHTVVRYLNPSSHAFMLYFVRGSRIALFSAALAVWILGPKEHRILHYRVFVVMGVRVARRFDDAVDDVDASTEKNPRRVTARY